MKAYTVLLLITLGLFSRAIAYGGYNQYSQTSLGRGGSNNQAPELSNIKGSAGPACDDTSFSFIYRTRWSTCVPCVDAGLALDMNDRRGPSRMTRNAIPTKGSCKFMPELAKRNERRNCGGNLNCVRQYYVLQHYPQDVDGVNSWIFTRQGIWEEKRNSPKERDNCGGYMENFQRGNGCTGCRAPIEWRSRLMARLQGGEQCE